MQLNSSFHFCDSFGKLRGNDRDLLLFLWGLGLSVNQLSPQDHDLVVARLSFIVELQQNCLGNQMEKIDVEIQRQSRRYVCPGFPETEGQREDEIYPSYLGVLLAFLQAVAIT